MFSHQSKVIHLIPDKEIAFTGELVGVVVFERDTIMATEIQFKIRLIEY